MMRIRKPNRRGAIVAVILAALAGQAQAQQCGPMRDVYDALGAEYGEAPVSRAISGRAIVEMWVNPASRSCTVLLTLPDGRACIIAACTDWEAMPWRQPVAGETS